MNSPIDTEDLEEFALAILLPHFNAVKDVYCEFPGVDRVRSVELVIDRSLHDGRRVYGACRDDGLQIRIAPEAIELPFEQAVAIIAHEFGHAADFLYPARWYTSWREPTSKELRQWQLRKSRQIELDADAIAMAVTGKKIRYAGPCLVQSFVTGQSPRPKQLDSGEETWKPVPE